jgi:hypothetical protein
MVTSRSKSIPFSIATALSFLLAAGGTAEALTAQQKCDKSRVKSWRSFVLCTQKVLFKDAKGVLSTPGSGDVFVKTSVALAKCRHKYFATWKKVQGGSYAGSDCAIGIGNRFTDSGDGTVTDNLSRLVWEKKNNRDGTADYGNAHDADNRYTWSEASVPPFREDGTAFSNFLPFLMFEGAFLGTGVGWRIPTFAELQSTVLDFPCSGSSCSCPESPCVAFDAVNTPVSGFMTVNSDVSGVYPGDATSMWMVATGDLPLAGTGLTIPAGTGILGFKSESLVPFSSYEVRAVRGGM